MARKSNYAVYWIGSHKFDAIKSFFCAELAKIGISTANKNKITYDYEYNPDWDATILTVTWDEEEESGS